MLKSNYRYIFILLYFYNDITMILLKLLIRLLFNLFLFKIKFIYNNFMINNIIS